MGSSTSKAEKPKRKAPKKNEREKQYQEPSTKLVDLPVELLQLIAAHLDGKSALRLGQTCHALFSICEDVLVHCAIIERSLEIYATEYNSEPLREGGKAFFKTTDSFPVPSLSVNDDIIVPLLMILRSPQHPIHFRNALAEAPYQWFSKLASILLERGSNGRRPITGMFDWGRLLLYPSECMVFIKPAMAFAFSVAVMYSRASGDESRFHWSTLWENVEKAAAINRLLFRHPSFLEFSMLLEVGLMYRSFEDFVGYLKLNGLPSGELACPSPPRLHQIPLSNICKRIPPPFLAQDTSARIYKSYRLNPMTGVQLPAVSPEEIASDRSDPHTPAIFSRSAEYLCTGSWLGFYTIDDPSIHEFSNTVITRRGSRQYSPLRMSRFMSSPVSNPGRGDRLECISNGIDCDGPFRLEGSFDMQSGRLEVLQRYFEVPDGSFLFRLSGFLTPFGIVGLWKEPRGEPYESWDGRFWIWRTAWTRGSDSNEVDGLKDPSDIQFEET